MEIHEENSPATDASSALVSALRRLLRPLIRLLVSKQISYPYLANLLKSLFVEVARDDIPTAGKALTDSRLSVMTGVHRKDVKRLLAELEAPAPIPANVSLGARLIARWNSEVGYLDASGTPSALPRLAQGDVGPSFERLVSEESKDIRPRAVLDEWLRLGLVSIDDQDRVCLVSGAFIPQHGEEEKLYFLGRNVRDHLESAVHNVLSEGPPRLERVVFADQLNAASVAELAALAEEMSMDMLRALNTRARELKTGQIQPGEHRMSLGVYFYRDGDKK